MMEIPERILLGFVGKGQEIFFETQTQLDYFQTYKELNFMEVNLLIECKINLKGGQNNCLFFFKIGRAQKAPHPHPPTTSFPVLSANVFVFGDLSIYHKDWLTFSSETDRLVNSVIIVLSQMILLRWLTFLFGFWTVLSQSCSFGFIYFLWH